MNTTNIVKIVSVSVDLVSGQRSQFSLVGRIRNVSVEYEPGKATRALFPLWAFDSLEHALAYFTPEALRNLVDDPDYFFAEVWFAHGTNIRPAPAPVNVREAMKRTQENNDLWTPDLRLATSIQSFWARTEDTTTAIPRSNRVEGAVICDEITLLRKVTTQELREKAQTMGLDINAED